MPPSHPASKKSPFYHLEQENADPLRIKKEREKARKAKQSQWWRDRLNAGICHYCQKKFKPAELTLDHVVPLARGGKSQPGNMVPACAECNRSKRLDTPVDRILRQLEEEKQ